ncbi:MAG: ABC transporter ATP-binding protein, partial [Alphaproteobacteria bacterium]|nr:ABC transporter ATP-binding protein [Alphaproteobacteria bacterium]
RYIVARLWRDYVRQHQGLFALAVLCMLISSSIISLVPVLLNWETKYIFLRHNKDWLVPLSLMGFGAMALRAVSMYLGRIWMDSLGEQMVADAQRDMFKSLIRNDLATLNAVHSGQFVSGFLYDATLIRDAFTQGIAAIFLEAVSMLGLMGYALVSDWQLGLLILIVLPGVGWTMERLGGSIRRAAARGMQETGDLSVVLSEALDGRRIVKSYGLEQHSIERVESRLKTRLKTLLKVVRLRDATAPLTDVFLGAAIALVLLVAGWQAIAGQITLNTFIAFTGAMILAQQPVRNISQAFPTAAAGVAAANRMFDVIDVRPAILDVPAATMLKVERAPKGGAVRFSNVSFAYHDAADSAITGIDLDIPPGSKVALVGPSGAGKTTIFNLLLRFYEVDGGSIVIDGSDIREVTLASLRANIGLVTQEPILFDESVAENIALGKPEASRAEIEAAARDAAAHDFIAELPQGYDTRVGEGGLKLSGGQRQRIAIARAMLKNAPILLLDEATSALDTASERQVQEALNRLMRERTTIVIAHRLSTVLDASRIYVLDRGGVAEAGTHAELMARNGLYADLYRHNLDGAA